MVCKIRNLNSLYFIFDLKNVTCSYYVHSMKTSRSHSNTSTSNSNFMCCIVVKFRTQFKIEMETCNVFFSIHSSENIDLNFTLECTLQMYIELFTCCSSWKTLRKHLSWKTFYESSETLYRLNYISSFLFRQLDAIIQFYCWQLNENVMSNSFLKQHLIHCIFISSIFIEW